MIGSLLAIYCIVDVLDVRGVTIQFAHDTIRISIQQPRYDSYLDSRYGGSKLSNMFWWTSGVLYSIVVMINELTELENRVTDYNSTTSETLEHCCWYCTAVLAFSLGIHFQRGVLPFHVRRHICCAASVVDNSSIFIDDHKAKILPYCWFILWRRRSFNLNTSCSAIPQLHLSLFDLAKLAKYENNARDFRF